MGAAACSPVPGYTVENDRDHIGDDINTASMGSGGAALVACDADWRCVGFTDRGWYKTNVTGVTVDPGFCLYTKFCEYLYLILVRRSATSAVCCVRSHALHIKLIIYMHDAVTIVLLPMLACRRLRHVLQCSYD